MPAIFSITGPIFLIIALGYAVVRVGWFSTADIRVLSRFVIHFTLPALLFRALSQRGFGEVMNLGFLFAYALGSIVALAIGVAAAALVRGKGLQMGAIQGLGMSLSNSAFIGYPIAAQLFGPVASVALALAMMVENLIILPVVLALAESGRSDGRGPCRIVLSTFSHLLRNPIILAIMAGFTCAILTVPLPGPLVRTVDLIASASAPVALFVIGGTLVGLKVGGMGPDVGSIVVGKLVLHPLAVLAAFTLVPGVDPVLRLAAVTTACAPMLSIYPIIGQKYGHERLCAAALVATTVISFFTISLLVWVFKHHGIAP